MGREGVEKVPFRKEDSISFSRAIILSANLRKIFLSMFKCQNLVYEREGRYL